MIIDDTFNLHSLLTITSAFKRFMLVDDSCRNHAMRSSCWLAPCVLPRKIVNKYGGDEVSTYDGVLKDVPQTWRDLVLIHTRICNGISLLGQISVLSFREATNSRYFFDRNPLLLNYHYFWMGLYDIIYLSYYYFYIIIITIIIIIIIFYYYHF